MLIDVAKKKIPATRQHVKLNSPLLLAAAMALPLALHAGSYTNNFDTSLGAGTLLGNAAYDSATASLRLTENLGSQSGAFVLGDLDPGKAINSFNATFALILGPGSGNAADGASFNFGTPATTAFGEDGPNSPHMLTVSFDIYDNVGGENKIQLRINGAQIADSSTTPDKTGISTAVVVHYDAAGLDVSYNNIAIFTDVQTPGFTPAAGDTFAFGARTGGETALQRVDTIAITTTTVPEPTTALLAFAGLGVLGIRRRRP
ncbi:MAG: hypothetical protein JWL90_3184 [Chthoniobacteraceae bacterium]|nr:hypothetical protein [Chthoniobacteraceae bacterium]